MLSWTFCHTGGEIYERRNFRVIFLTHTCTKNPKGCLVHFARTILAIGRFHSRAIRMHPSCVHQTFVVASGVVGDIRTILAAVVPSLCNDISLLPAYLVLFGALSNLVVDLQRNEQCFFMRCCFLLFASKKNKRQGGINRHHRNSKAVVSNDAICILWRIKQLNNCSKRKRINQTIKINDIKTLGYYIPYI